MSTSGEKTHTPSAALIDKHLDIVLKASGSALRYYTMPAVLDSMRHTMRQAMREAIAERDAESASRLRAVSQP